MTGSCLKILHLQQFWLKWVTLKSFPEYYTFILKLNGSLIPYPWNTFPGWKMWKCMKKKSRLWGRLLFYCKATQMLLILWWAESFGCLTAAEHFTLKMHRFGPFPRCRIVTSEWHIGRGSRMRKRVEEQSVQWVPLACGGPPGTWQLAGGGSGGLQSACWF